jgi:hypothetical protein
MVARRTALRADRAPGAGSRRRRVPLAQLIELLREMPEVPVGQEPPQEEQPQRRSNSASDARMARPAPFGGGEHLLQA